MKKRIEPYVKVRKNLFRTKELSQLIAEEGSEGVGAYMIITFHAAECPDGICPFTQLRSIATVCRKSQKYLNHVICDYNLFNVRSDCFQSKLLCQTMVLENVLDSGRNPVRSEAGPRHESIAPPCITRTDDNNNNDNDNKDKTSSAEEVKEESAAAVDLFLNKIFADTNWLNAIEKDTMARVYSDATVRSLSKEWLHGKIIANGCDGDAAFSVKEAKQYFRRLLNREHHTRTEYDEYIYRSTRPHAESHHDGKSIYECMQGGSRFGYHHEPLPDSAPRQDNMDCCWSYTQNRWVHVSEYNAPEENKAVRVWCKQNNRRLWQK